MGPGGGCKSGRGGMSPRTLPRHARRLVGSRRAGRGVQQGPPSPADAQAPRPPARQDPQDPLVHPVAITEHSVIGNRIRVPAAWCDIPGCGARFADAAALGEADNRARALAAGWGADDFGWLMCPACRQRHGVAPARDTNGWSAPQPVAVPSPRPRTGLAGDPALRHPQLLTPDGTAWPG